jgi:hypothetical protein
MAAFTSFGSKIVKSGQHIKSGWDKRGLNYVNPGEDYKKAFKELWPLIPVGDTLLRTIWEVYQNSSPGSGGVYPVSQIDDPDELKKFIAWLDIQDLEEEDVRQALMNTEELGQTPQTPEELFSRLVWELGIGGVITGKDRLGNSRRPAEDQPIAPRKEPVVQPEEKTQAPPSSSGSSSSNLAQALGSGKEVSKSPSGRLADLLG